ncbi:MULTISPECIES: RHS repeat domain-containing protein [unclassified Pseudomonas]|uniref:RHS repeat domain-containing protein n=1 Tax=unclassified Pseudomonas TaxID=196821 RepID=UPI00215BB5CF|nr:MULTISPECIES: RHS repeat-associated core domain-containing protein [unclassified Pseudomonas]MCR8930585.1 RHS repeat protein [Pseudomonas sp. S11A4]MCR8974185.1 RHS repeat protein [Pseudomonas sp. S11P7]
MDVHHDTATPTLSVIDSRSLMIRSVGYCRHPDSPDIDPRITRHVFDAAGRQVASWDPRLWGTAPKPNLATTYGLSGQALLTDSVDAGWQLSLPDQARSLRCSWDARGSECNSDYDDLQRPIVVREQARGEPPRVVERLSYADADDVYARHNQCGRLIRHDDPAGSRLINDYGLAGAELVESRRMLTDLDLPDWPGDPERRDVFLEAQSYVTRYVFFPTGELKEQTDAMGNAQTFHHDVAGKLSALWLHPAGADRQPKCLVTAIRYNAHEQIEHETTGNGVTTRAEYSPEDGRLLKLSAAVGEQTPLQNLHYVYDPVGNIVSLEDKTQAVTYFNQQRIEPVSRYRYDSLYQLVQAKGWEVSQPSHGPALPDLLPTPLDPNQRRNYIQTFNYDAAGNLLARHHSDAPGFSMFTSAYSNRSLGQRDDASLPGEPQISEGFDLAGNQLQLQRGQAMSWDVRNQLRRVTLVQRQDEPDDDEVYVYDRPGHRLRKTRLSQTSGQDLKSEVRYLPGLEVHREANGKERHVIIVAAGRNQVRMLHWPDGAESDQLRYSLSDHLGSSTLELDDGAGILSQEHYYPFGGTACWAGKSALVAKYKTIRYSGKERDATGLYYYGYRYYAPWLQRWVNPDPAWDVDGLNLFRVLRNSPVSLREYTGLSPVPPNNVTPKQEHLDQVDNFSNDLPRNAPDQIPEINTVKVNEEFLSRVSDYFQNNIGRITQLNSLLEHKPIDAVKISSGRMIFPEDHGSDGQVIKDEFINEYHPSGVWIFRGNYKESKTKQFFASDVQLVQAAYMGITDYPSMMVRNEVKNKETLAATEKFASDSIELKEAFFTTPNGKNTAQILKALDMEATSVKRSVSPHADFPSFYIAVRPKARGGIEKPNL